jgi:Dyp-type peroxidase family
MLELDDIQAGVLRPRPAPYAATYILFRIDHSAGGRELLKRLLPVVASAAEAGRAPRDAWVSVAITFQGLRALRVPQAALDSFAPEFRQGMAARARALGDVGESDPANWERPLGSPDVHIVVTVLAQHRERLDAALARARDAYREIDGITPIWRQDCHALPNEKEAFGYRDGISHPAIEGSGIPGTNPEEAPLKAGEFVLGYGDEMSDTPSLPQPEVLGRNGSYVAFRKLHQRVAAFRRYVRANSADAQAEELLAAKMMGRWRSGAPLALCPLHDNADLGGDPQRNNAFGFKDDDAIGYKTPPGSHIRRMNPRDADVAGVVRIHRMIRRGTSYGPPLPEGVLEDDGVDRGLMFAFIGVHLGRQFEFVQSEWINGSEFFAGRPAKDPLAGANDDAGTYDIPQRPLPKRLQGLPRFVVTRGGEYCFLPGLRALRWLAEQR